MTFHSLLVFAHILGAVGLFAAIGIESVSLGRLLEARTAGEARTWLGPLASSGRLGGSSMLVVLASGIWMGVTVYGHQWWMLVAFVGTLVMGAMGGGVTSRRVRRLGRALADVGPETSETLRALLAGRTLVVSLRLRITLAVGVVALMTLKPDPLASAVILGASLVAGVAAGAVAASPARAGGLEAAGR